MTRAVYVCYYNLLPRSMKPRARRQRRRRAWRALPTETPADRRRKFVVIQGGRG